MTDDHHTGPDDLRDAFRGLPGIDEDALIAATDVIGRTGARELTCAYLHDNVPVEQAGWWATASYHGTKIITEDHAGPVQAIEALARKLLTGGKCIRCGGLISLSDEGAVAFPGATMADGTVWTEEQIHDAGQCRWRRVGPRWEQGCPASHPAEPGDEVHTTEKLARALEELDDPSLYPLILRARGGYYHDFLSPLAMPEVQLMNDLRRAGHPAFAARVLDGEFDASPAEIAAWRASPEGQAVADELMPGGSPVPGSPTARIIDLLAGVAGKSASDTRNAAATRPAKKRKKRIKRKR